MKTTHHRVVITGIGPVTAIGTGKEAFWKNLLAGNSNICKIPARFETNHTFKSRFYVPFPDIHIQDYNLPRKYENLMELSTRAAVIASKIAMEDAGVIWNEDEIRLPVDPERFLIVLGTGICTLKAGFYAYESHALNPSLRYNRMVIPMIMPDSASSWISILAGIKGANYTLNASCASGTVAIGEAFRQIRDGSTEMALAGGFECLKDESGTIMRGFDGLGTLSTSSDGFPRPFSNARSGFLFAEGGACILVIETLDSAIKRGAEPYAEIIDYKCNSDAFNIVQMDPSGNGIQTMLKEIVNEKEIDYFNAHGTATQLNDEIEAQLMRILFGKKETQPLINSTKSITGHSIGASGAIEAAVTALSIKKSMIHKTITNDAMEELNLATENTSCNIKHAISGSYGFGGHNAALLMGSIESF